MRGPTWETSELGLSTGSVWVVHIKWNLATINATFRQAAGKHLSTSICRNKVQHRAAALVPIGPDTPKSHRDRSCSSATTLSCLEHK